MRSMPKAFVITLRLEERFENARCCRATTRAVWEIWRKLTLMGDGRGKEWMKGERAFAFGPIRKIRPTASPWGSGG
jgi:hypothetical protein